MRRRLVIREPVGPQEFARFAEEREWEPVRPVPPDGEAGAVALVWHTLTGAEVAYLRDPLLRHTCVQIDGERTAGAEALVRGRFDCHRPTDGAAEFGRARTWAERVNALRLVAAAADAYDEPTHAVIEASLHDDRPEVRLLGTVAAAYAAWPPLRPALAAAAARDQDPDVRLAARDALTVLDARSEERA